jgi:hemoglobin
MDDITTCEEQLLRPLVDRFYARVRADPDLGPLFDGAVADWDDHRDRLVAFWSSIMLTSGRYKGDPMAAHLPHRAAMSPALFHRWLALWRQTTGEVLPPALAALMQAKAERIAASLARALGRQPAA